MSDKQTIKQRRFIPADKVPAGEKPYEEIRWWYDTERPLTDPEQPYIAVEVYADKDPNDYVRIAGEMRLLFQDQAEYYVVCVDCWYSYSVYQWSGSTRGIRDWRERAEKHRQVHQSIKGWCQFCDPIFGNGGWRI